MKFLFVYISMKVWLDDERKMPVGFDIHLRTAAGAIEYLKTGKVTLISLDHDLGEEKGTGYEVAKFIEEAAFNQELTRLSWEIHSANPVGRKNMEAALLNANLYWNRH